ncbi:transcription factor bHLH168-like [Solanum stenotomum]|uniref:transcription factor bHLH168-like n=1 Tax=Solanum stenotomum TaxID=172797 RepID=UPI0020D161D6|nr:transcription factor bHLH168-like [Solanum stenotomum]
MESSNVNIVGTSTSQKIDRKTQEKNRRVHMKHLSSKLFSLIPSNYSKEVRTKQDHVDQAISYIGELKERVEVLKKRKEEVAQGTNDHSRKSMSTTSCTIKTPNMVEFRELDSTLEVIILTSGLQKNFTLQEVIKIIEEEGAQVVTANYSTLEDAIYYTIHAQVKITRLGVDASSIHLRLQNLLF